MHVSMEQIQRGVVNYADVEIGRKATGLSQFLVYLAIPSIGNKVPDYIDKFRDIASDVFDDGGNIDIDVLRVRGREAMEKCGCIELAGIRFRSDDVEKLCDFIREA